MSSKSKTKEFGKLLKLFLQYLNLKLKIDQLLNTYEIDFFSNFYLAKSVSFNFGLKQSYVSLGEKTLVLIDSPKTSMPTIEKI